jgi:hypothetical protein
LRAGTEFIVAEKSGEFASLAAGQIAIQTLLSLVVNLYIGDAEDPEQARDLITDMAEEMVDSAFIPDLPPAESKAARAKELVRQLIGGHQATSGQAAALSFLVRAAHHSKRIIGWWPRGRDD